MESLHPYLRIALLLAISLALFAVGRRTMRRIGIDPTKPTRRSSVKGSLVAAAINVMVLMITLIFFRKVDGVRPRMLGFRFDAPELLFTGVILAVTMAVAYAATRLAGREAPVRKNRDGEEPTTIGPFPVLLMVLAVFLSAWQEEILFRGYLFWNLAGAGAGPVAALLVASVLFAAVHYLSGPITIWRGVNWLACGIAFGVIYLVSGSIWAATAAHTARTLANFLFLSGMPELSPVHPVRTVSEPVRTGCYVLLSACTVAVALAIYGTDGGLLVGAPFVP